MTARHFTVLATAILTAATAGCGSQYPQQASRLSVNAPATPAASRPATTNDSPHQQADQKQADQTQADQTQADQAQAGQKQAATATSDPKTTDLKTAEPATLEPGTVDPGIAEPQTAVKAASPVSVPEASSADIATGSDVQAEIPRDGELLAQAPAKAVETSKGSKDKDSKDKAAASQLGSKPLPRPVGPSQTYYLTFDDLEINMKESQKFEKSMLTPNVRKLNGKRVRISGVIHAGSIFKQSGIRQFVMLKNAECPFGPGATAHHNMRVTIAEGIDFTTRPVTIEGTLKVDPFNGPDGTTWALYTLTGEAR